MLTERLALPKGDAWGRTETCPWKGGSAQTPGLADRQQQAAPSRLKASLGTGKFLAVLIKGRVCTLCPALLLVGPGAAAGL